MSIYKGFCKDERFWPPTSQKFQPNLNTVIYTVPKCQKVLDPNLPKVLVISWVPQILEDSAPNNSKVPQCQTVLFKGFHNAKRFWPQTSQKLHNASVMYRVPNIEGFSPKQFKSSTVPNSVIHRVPQCQASQKFRSAKHCYLQGFAVPKGFGPKRPKSCAMTNTVICRVPQRLKALSAKQPKSSTMPNTVIYTVLQCQKGFGPKPPRS